MRIDFGSGVYVDAHIAITHPDLPVSPRPAVVKEILPIHFDLPDRSPLRCRSCPEFGSYFNHIWKELGMYEAYDSADPLGGEGALPAAESSP